MPLVFGDLISCTCALGSAVTLAERPSDLFLLQDLFEIDASSDCPSGLKRFGAEEGILSLISGVSPAAVVSCWPGAPAFPASFL